MADLLVLGGGGFLGYHAVVEARAAGHGVAVLSRSGRAPVDGVEVLTGDRRGDLGALRGRTWDAVVDTFTDPRPGAPAIRATAELLSGSVGSYVYVSGMSVYAPHGPAVPDESAPVRAAGREPDDDPLQERSLAKLAGEAGVREAFAGPALFPRVGIMVGPRDPSRRFTYWPVRFADAVAGRASRTVLVPGDLDRPVQYSDARDVARWMVTAGLSGLAGTFNVVGPGRPDPLRTVLAACLDAAGGRPDSVRLTSRTEDELRAGLTDVEEEGRPLWFPEDQIPQRAIDSEAAVRAGLRFRPAAETAADTLAWALGVDDQRTVAADFAGRERALLG